MARRSNYRELTRFKERLQRNLQGAELDKFIRDCTKFLMAEFLKYVIMKTPVDDKNPNHQGGTLRRGWIAGAGGDAFSQANLSPSVVEGLAKEFMQSVNVLRVGRSFVVRVINNTAYASYVEFGHRTRNGGGVGFVEGQHFAEDTEREIETHSGEMLEYLLRKKLEGVMQ